MGSVGIFPGAVCTYLLDAFDHEHNFLRQLLRHERVRFGGLIRTAFRVCCEFWGSGVEVFLSHENLQHLACRNSNYWLCYPACDDAGRAAHQQRDRGLFSSMRIGCQLVRIEHMVSRTRSKKG